MKNKKVIRCVACNEPLSIHPVGTCKGCDPRKVVPAKR